jgi:hypothetical protein
VLELGHERSRVMVRHALWLWNQTTNYNFKPMLMRRDRFMTPPSGVMLIRWPSLVEAQLRRGQGNASLETATRPDEDDRMQEDWLISKLV